MTTLMDPQVRERTRARRVELSKGIGEPTAGERRAREDIRASFDRLDGSDGAYLALLTGASIEDLRRVGAA
ncbi:MULTISPECIES: hypothetical protein [Streptomyces]|uniref:hypothetical protein n=1 Tax=Streptomyces TaxID=1883 RepID=UPI0013D92A0B|nr:MULTISPECIES: hypothetical protein [unclassified Streptomyces]MBQ1112444.1 hypothetical protein [Streptomyces sp. C3-3]